MITSCVQSETVLQTEETMKRATKGRALVAKGSSFTGERSFRQYNPSEQESRCIRYAL